MRELRLTWATLGLTFILLVAGGLVHATGSALACPDWPLCYGSAFPTMKGIIFYEHGHRLIAGTVALLTLVLAYRLLKRLKNNPPYYRLGLAAFAALLSQPIVLGRAGMLLSGGSAYEGEPRILIITAVITGLFTLGAAFAIARKSGGAIPAVGLFACQIVFFQAGLGGLTVLLKLPTLVSTLHLSTAMIYFMLMIFLSFRLRLKDAATGEPIVSRHLLGVALGTLYAQIVYGALIRHTGSALACNVDLFTCNGALIPESGAGWLLSGHRYFAFIVAALVIIAALKAIKAAQSAGRKLAAGLAQAAIALVLTQVVLGFLTVTSYVSISFATLHLAGGSMLLATVVTLFFALGPMASATEQTIEGAAV